MTRPLPGREAQLKMAHIARQRYDWSSDRAKQAGVLALLFPKKKAWHTVLIERQSHKNDRHSGQISFPGGKYEPGDQQLSNTALREAQEEVGLNKATIRILGPLTELYIPVSNFMVNPFLAVTDQTPIFKPDRSEVREILEVPLDLLLDPASVRYTDMQLAQNVLLRSVPHFSIFGKVVWGATAMMISELLEIVRKN